MQHTSLPGGAAVPAILACLAVVLPAEHAPAQQAQHHIFTLTGDAPGDRFGYAVGALADLDRDGHNEICVGADAANSQTGYVRVFGGKTGATMATLLGAAAGDRFGYAVSPAGDVNKDGFEDLLIGAPGSTTTPGYAQVVSGLWILTNSGPQTLYTFNGTTAGDEYGITVAAADDVDRDGNPDMLVGARQPGTGTGYAEVRSGKTGSVIHSFPGPAGIKFFGRSMSNVGDINGDGHPDALIGGAFLWQVFSGKDGAQLRSIANQGGKSVSGAGDVNLDGVPDLMIFVGNSGLPKSVRVFSGKDWTVLHNLTAGGDGPEATMMAPAGDVNRDGHQDLVVGNCGNATYPVRIYSGKDGTMLQQFSGTTTFGHAVRGAGDVNGDGELDIVIGAAGTATTLGSVSVYSGTALPLASDKHQIPIAQGGTQSLLLDFGSTHANRLYWIFGSITGTAPGVTLSGVHIPLNPDPYTDLGIANVAANPPFNAFRGVLDASGMASAALIVPTGLPPLPFTLYHACLVYDAAGRFYTASPAVPISLR